MPKYRESESIYLSSFELRTMSKTSVISAVKRFLAEEDGPTAVEYAVMLALILLSVMGTVGILATETKDNFDRSATAISGAIGN